MYKQCFFQYGGHYVIQCGTLRVEIVCTYSTTASYLQGIYNAEFFAAVSWGGPLPADVPTHVRTTLLPLIRSRGHLLTPDPIEGAYDAPPDPIVGYQLAPSALSNGVNLFSYKG